tara:strand:+ start:2865 stop:6233 length:3369 start_codon:yes stop_codon:yes gene_type:complete
MADGITFESLIASISGMGSASGQLADISATGRSSRVLPLVDYNDFSQHIFFGNAIRRFDSVRKYIIDKYPIGLSGLSAGTELQTAAVGIKAIFEVDKFRKEADGFTGFLLDRLGVTGSTSGSLNATADNTVLAKNQNGENVSLIALYRNTNNSITGSQTGMIESISARANNYEVDQLNVIDQTAGTGTEIVGTSTGVTRSEIIYAATAETSITRSEKLQNLLPATLFTGDDQDVLARLLSAFGDELDEIKSFANQIPSVKNIDYGEINRTPNKFIPIFLKQFGVRVFENARKSAISQSLINTSPSGYTTQQINYEIWNRILNNVMHLIKTKGTRETLESIGRIYGVDSNFLKVNEYSIFAKPIEVTETEQVDIPVLFATGSIYAQTVANKSAGVFDFQPTDNFTIEMRVSATGTSTTGHTLLVHPTYRVELDPSGQVSFKSTATASLSAQTTQSSISSFIQGAGSANNFLNVAVSRSGDTVNVYSMVLSATPSGGYESVVTDTSSTSQSSGDKISEANFSSSGGSTTFPAYFPGSGDTRFTGYMHEVRVWKVALKQTDLEEHAKNFESVSFQGSTATDTVNSVNNAATYSSLSAHYKLREDVVLTNPYNFIVDSTTAGNTATPVSFSDITTKRYRVFSDMRKIVKYIPAGLAPDNDRIRQDAINGAIEDTGYISISLNPINAINRNIKNYFNNISPPNLLGDPGDLYKPAYKGEFQKRWHEITSQWGLAKNSGTSLAGDDGWSATGKSQGVTGSTVGLADINTFIKGMDNFNDTFGGIFQFAQQFIPAKSSIIGEGLFVENHMLERSKMKRQFGFRESSGTAFVGAPTTSGDIGHLSDDVAAVSYNQTPSVFPIETKYITIATHYTGSNLSATGAASANQTALAASAATTASFMGYMYDGLQQTITNAVTADRALPNLTIGSTVNTPRFSPTRIGRFLPVKVIPSVGAASVVDVTLDKLLISPTGAPIATNEKGIIKGTARLLTKGRSFKTDQPALRFEFPASADGTNFFEATIGNISQGQGRVIKNKDTQITSTLETEVIEFELRLARVITSLTAVNVAAGVTKARCDDTVSGSVGIVPIRVVNLFNNDTNVFRVAINADSTKDTEFIRQLADQGGVKVTS